MTVRPNPSPETHARAINLRVREETRALIDRAAQAQGREAETERSPRRRNTAKQKRSARRAGARKCKSKILTKRLRSCSRSCHVGALY